MLLSPRNKFILKAKNNTLKLGPRTLLMGIINLTPDSFSGDGLYKCGMRNAECGIKKIVEIAQKMINDGADILDIGGESSRPGALPIDTEEELQRVIPVIKILAKKIEAPISIDTYKAEVAKQALENGASIVNDISALSDKNMPEIIKKYKAAVILMHMEGKPLNMQDNPRYKNLIPDIIKFFKQKIKLALDSGINSDRIIIDPGIGFGKTLEHNLKIISHLSEFKKLGYPLLIGPSRKSFIAKLLGDNTGERVFGTAASIALSIASGAHIVRVHDIKQMRDVAKISDAIIKCR